MTTYQRIDFKVLNREFIKVQCELEEIGLLKENKYLGKVELVQSSLPSFCGEMGYVYDSEVGILGKSMGYQKGTIYIPSYALIDKYIPGGTLIDTIRHEYAHAWAAHYPNVFEKKWFKNTFGLSYWDDWVFGNALYKFFSKYDLATFKNSPYYLDFVSPYALSSPSEDFAETFMFYLKYRKSLNRFRCRKGVYKKLISVDRIIKKVEKVRELSK